LGSLKCMNELLFVKFRFFTHRVADFDYRMIAKIYKTKLMM